MEGVAIAGFVLSLLISIIALVRSYGEDRGEQRVWKAMVSEKLKLYEDHSKDENAHWTERERDDVVRRLNVIETLVRESMTPRGSRLRDEQHRGLTED